MKLSDIIKGVNQLERLHIRESKDKFTTVSTADYEKWVELLTDMVESDGVDFDEAIDVLDQDPKFEALSPAEQKRVLTKIRKLYYESIH